MTHEALELICSFAHGKHKNPAVETANHSWFMSLELFIRCSDASTAGQYMKRAHSHLCLLIKVVSILVQEVSTQHGDWQVAFTQLAELPGGDS